MTRVGIGLDFHRLEEGESLILGGVEYDHATGTLAHSDGDVLVHAICDAILGAAGLGDIGSHFPDDDPAYEGISSIKLLEKVLNKVTSEGFELVNVDSTLIIQEPKLGEGREEMMEKLGNVIGAPVNVKATTTEQLGFIGREEGVGAQAVVTLSRRNEDIDV
ncbi:MAG: 2-C-methyl-D-erythritol 2,4-cyclodiphosphate synthase [Candidatus Bipolaricaulota bacterium]|nr:2-C-methyl-D-erythritol 2,4-cyclodiphosphate synthase [Candidatus Bipolaricaulota bacterium]